MIAERLPSVGLVRARLRGVPELTLVWLGLVCGSVLVPYSYAYAAGHADGDRVHFALFWAGELVFFVPALVLLLRPATGRGVRLAVVAATGAFDFLPKFLRDPHFPLFHDELLHSRELAHVVATGKLFQPAPVLGIIRFFPGLHGATAALVRISGAPEFAVQTSLVLVLHVAVLVGVFALAETVTDSPRAGSLAAFAYALNPSFLFFDTQFAYESLAIVLFIWVLVALVRAEAADGRAEAARWLALGVLLGAACVVTHHLTSYALIVTLAIATVAALARRRSRHVAPSAVLATVLAGAVVAWTAFVASGVVAYLAPHFSGGVAQLLRLVAREQQAHTLFAHSTSPLYEQWAGRLAPVIAFGLVLVALRRVRVTPPRSAFVAVAVVLAGLYFVSLPFIYTTAGNEGARRSWAFSYLGVAFLAAVAFERLPRAAIATPLAVVLGSVMLVGNVATGINAYYRFPGPASTRSEVRTTTPELRAAAGWLRATQPAPRRLLTDRESSPAFAFFGDAEPGSPSTGFPIWRLFLSARPPTAVFAHELRTSGYDLVVVNAPIPLLRTYYSSEQTDVLPTTAKVSSRAVITRLDAEPWAAKVYGSDGFGIYRLDFGRLARGAP